MVRRRRREDGCVTQSTGKSRFQSKETDRQTAAIDVSYLRSQGRQKRKPLPAVSTRSFREPEKRQMAKHRGGRTTRTKHEDDLQRDDRGAGHATPKRSEEHTSELQ